MQDFRAIAALAGFVLLTVALLPVQAALTALAARSGRKLATGSTGAGSPAS